MADKNALADLAERLKNGYVSLVVNGRQVATFATAAFPGLDEAQRIVAELAKVQDEEAALFSMKYVNPDEARRIVRQRVGNCILKCRAIAEEGANNGR